MSTKWTHHVSPTVIPVLPDALRGAGRSHERRIRRIRLRECGPERTERVLVKIYVVSSVELERLLRMTKKNRFVMMIAALRKRFDGKDTKIRPISQQTNADGSAPPRHKKRN